jgi:hypothetical protein
MLFLQAEICHTKITALYSNKKNISNKRAVSVHKTALFLWVQSLLMHELHRMAKVFYPRQEFLRIQSGE